MFYKDIVECIKMNQIKQSISNRTLAKRLGVSETTITDIRGYRMKVSSNLFDKIIAELSIIDISENEKERLLNTQDVAKKNRHRRYIREINNKNNM